MSFLTDDFGKKVEVPAWTAIDPTQNQKDTVTGNLQTLPGAEQLATNVNTFNLKELERMFGLSQETLKKIGANIGAMARGEIDQDVQDQITNSGAVKALGQGLSGTGMHRNLVARDLGMTSLDLKTKGMDSATRWMAASNANSFNVSSMFLSPEQRYGQADNERNLKFKHEYLKAQIEAMPDPGVRGIMDAVRAAGVAYLGGNYDVDEGSNDAPSAEGMNSTYNSGGGASSFGSTRQVQSSSGNGSSELSGTAGNWYSEDSANAPSGNGLSYGGGGFW